MLVTEVRHPNSLDFANERKVVLLRGVKKLKWKDVQGEVRNLQGKAPSISHLKKVYKEFSKTAGRRKYKYMN